MATLTHKTNTQLEGIFTLENDPVAPIPLVQTMELMNNDMDDMNNEIVALAGAMIRKGTIAAAANFPLIALVQTGWTYRVTTGCTDNAGATYTNTGLVFVAEELIVWSGATWVRMNQSTAAHLDGGVSKHDATEVDVEGALTHFPAGGLQASLAAADADIIALAAGGSGFWSDTADGNIGTRCLVEIDGAGDLVAGSVGSDSVVGVNLNAGPCIPTDPIVVGNGHRGVLAADVIPAGQDLKCAETGMVIRAITLLNSLASLAIGASLGVGFTNQPANDGILVVSDGADVRNVTLIGTTWGGLVVVEETITLTGAVPVATLKLDWDLLLAAKVDAPDGARTITISEASGGLAITTIAPAATGRGVVVVPTGNQQAYNAIPTAAAEAGTTKRIGVKRIGTTGTAEVYEAIALNGTNLIPLTVSRRITELYVGDLEGGRTLTVRTTANADNPTAIVGRSYSAAAARGDSLTANLFV